MHERVVLGRLRYNVRSPGLEGAPDWQIVFETRPLGGQGVARAICTAREITMRTETAREVTMGDRALRRTSRFMILYLW